jgi:hypothetical protein
VASLDELLSKDRLTLIEKSELSDRIRVLEAGISNMKKMLSRTPEETWIDYSTLSTVAGWSAYTDKQIFCHIRGDLVTVWFYIKGTSDSVHCTFTVPYAMRTNVYSTPFAVAMWDNGTIVATPGMGVIYGSTGRVVYVYMDWAGGNFTASGDKIIHGHFSYRRAP